MQTTYMPMLLASTIGGEGSPSVLIPEIARFLGLIIGIYYLMNLVSRRFGILPIVPALFIGIVFGKTVMSRLFDGWHLGLLLGENHHLEGAIFILSGIGLGQLLHYSGLKTSAKADPHAKPIDNQKKLIIAVGVFASTIIFSLAYLIFLPFSDSREALGIAVLAMIAAVVTIATILKGLGIRNTLEADIIFTICIINEVMAWMLINAVLGYYGGAEKTLFWGVLWPAITTVALTLFSFTVGRDIAHAVSHRIKKKSDKLLVHVAFVGLGVYFASLLGVGYLFSFFLLGVLLGKSGTVPEEVRDNLVEFGVSVLVPLFFATVAINYDLFAIQDWPWIAFIVLVLSALKYTINTACAFFASRSWWISSAIGISLVPGGAIEITIAKIFWEIDLVSESTFWAIVIHVIVTASICGNLLKWSLKLKKVNLVEYFHPRAGYLVGAAGYLSPEGIDGKEWEIRLLDFKRSVAGFIHDEIKERFPEISLEIILCAIDETTPSWQSMKVKDNFMTLPLSLRGLTSTIILPIVFEGVDGFKVEEGDIRDVDFLFVVIGPEDGGSDLVFVANLSDLASRVKSRTSNFRKLFEHVHPNLLFPKEVGNCLSVTTHGWRPENLHY